METDKKPKTVSFREYLIDLLKDPSEAEAYIEAASEENDPELLELAYRDVEEARKQVSKLRD
jgi:DNA-binding phage protein